MTGSAPLSRRLDSAFWHGRRVLVTGHTGFKGVWLCLLLDRLGARVSGLALPAPRDGAFDAMRPPAESHMADIRDVAAVSDVIRATQPQIVLHLAAQALVGESYTQPLETFATNVMGTANLLEALRAAPPAVVLVVTTDKVYRPQPDSRPFLEDSPLGGTDPYSASKAAAEHVVACWRERLREIGCIAATARAGNVLGGGDIAAERLAPDVIRAHCARVPLTLRRPDAVRPWQYVLDVLTGYLLYVQALFQDEAPPALNFGPGANTAITASALTEQLQRALCSTLGWQQGPVPFHETATLLLDSTRAFETLGWRTTTGIDQAIAWTAAWHQAAWAGQDMHRVGHAQIDEWLIS